MVCIGAWVSGTVLVLEVVGEARALGRLVLLLEGRIVLFALPWDPWQLLLRLGDAHAALKTWVAVLAC